MIQPHPEEEGWQAKRFREAEEKKLFTLHTENQRLLTQQYEFEGVIADYAHKIDSFSEKSRRLEDENKELRAEVESLTSRNRRAEDALSKRNEEYCTLYNYLFTEKRGTLQDAFLKEIDLSNRLNEIQHESDTQIINKLKNTIKNKNQELLRNSQRISELNEALISSSFEYHEKIDVLKSQNERLQKSALPLQSSLPALQSINQYCLNKKIESLLKEVNLFKLELEANKHQLSAFKKNYSDIEGEKLAIESELNSIKKHMNTFDGSIYDVFRENNSLKELLERERIYRSEEVQRHYPQLAKRPEDLNNFLNAKEVEGKLKKEIDQLKDQTQSQKKELETLRGEHKRSKEARLEAEKKYESLRIVSTSAFQKLKNVISTYVPYYFRRGGLENYNLDKEEQEFIAQRNVEKTLQAAYTEVNSKIAEAGQSKQRQAEADEKNIQNLQRIRLLQKELARKEGEIAVLSGSVESLMEAKKSHDCSINNRYGYVGQEQDELNQIVNDDQEYVPRILPATESLEKGYQIKIQILEKAIEELQTDRTELIDIIKSKEVLIAQLAADVKALSSTSHFRNVNIQPLSFSEPRPILPLYQRQQQFENDERPYSQHELAEIREDLRQVSTEYKLQRQLLIKESEQKEAASLSKYLTLLRQFNDLTSKYNALEASVNSNPIPQANIQDQNHQSASELPLELPEAHHQPQRDQATISESAIENFTDTLKKYEKEFNRFVGIYEAQIKKSMESSMISELAHESEGESQPHSEDQNERLQAMLSQHHDTIKHLESLLEQKNSQTELQVAQLENALKESKEQALTTSRRLEDAETTIADLKSQFLSEKTGQDFTSSESANTAFLILNAKNKQIDELKAALEKLRRSYEDKSREWAQLREVNCEHSQVQVEEYRIFREIMEEEDLVEVLEAAARRLA